MKIEHVSAQEIFDSRGIPTIECEIILEDGKSVVASVPSGISRGMHEAIEIRDGGDRFMGLGTQKAVKIIEEIIAPVIIDREPDIITIDCDLIELDGTDDKSHLGANAILAISIAVCRAQAYAESLTVYELIAHLCHFESVSLPRPMINLIGGGLHAHNNLPIQEILIVPMGENSFEEAFDVGVDIYHCLKEILEAKGKLIAVGYEGEFVPQFADEREALDIIMEAIEKFGNGKQVMISLDVAASHFYNIETGLYAWHKKSFMADDLIEKYKQLIADYPIYSIEDGLSEVDWANWTVLKDELGNHVKIIGDDLFATNSQRIWTGIEKNVATTALIKPNQIGTITEALQAIMLCKENEWDVIVSHRSGETNDSFIADLAVGVSASHIKAGGCSRGERMAKYNRLLQIERELLSGQIQH